MFWKSPRPGRWKSARSMAAKPHQKPSSTDACPLGSGRGRLRWMLGPKRWLNAFYGLSGKDNHELRKTPEWNKIIKHCSEEEKGNTGFPEYFRIASVV